MKKILVRIHAYIQIHKSTAQTWSKIKLRPAFTLAEVIIVMGIIGMIADLTLPGLIKNFEKAQTVSRLKKVYSTLNQAIDMAKTEHGTNVADWNFLKNRAIGGGSLGYTSLHYPSQQFVDTYLKPYLKVAEDCSYTSTRAQNASWVARCGTVAAGNYKIKYLCSAVKNECNFRTIVEAAPLGVSYSRLLLQDGTLLQMYMGETLQTENLAPISPGVCPPSLTCALRAEIPESQNDLGETIPGTSEYCQCYTDKYVIQTNIYVDLNGLKPPNVFGKDIFLLTLNRAKGTVNPYGSGNPKRTTLKSGCGLKTRGLYCAALIIHDGWSIAPDYPWR